MTVRRRRLGGALVALAVVLASAVSWVLAGKARSPRQLAADAAAPPPSTITVPVRFEQLARTALLDCEGEPAVSLPVPVTAPEGAEPVVTRLPVRAGGRVTEGTVVLEISGRPVILIQGRLPSYRDLVPGAQGPDVRQLQGALARLGHPGGSSGVFDGATRRAVLRLYRSLGYLPATAVVQGEAEERTKKPDLARSLTLPRGELLVARALPLRVGPTRARIGAVARTGGLVLEGGEPRLRCPIVDQGAVDGLRRGARATVTDASGREFGGRVLRITSSGEGDERRTDVLVEPSRKVPTRQGAQARIEVERAEEKGPVVPASALWSRPNGKTVVLVVRGGNRTEVAVEPGFEVDGMVQLIVGEDALRENDEVVVSSEEPAP